MRRLSGRGLVLAVLLAALLPLEQSHCLFMPFEAQAAPHGAATAGATDHSCCAPSPDAQPQPARDLAECPCNSLPDATVPQGVVTTPHLENSGLVLLVWTGLLAAPQAAAAPTPAPDIGSPPLPIACDAHGLRAPPLSA